MQSMLNIMVWWLRYQPLWQLGQRLERFDSLNKAGLIED